MSTESKVRLHMHASWGDYYNEEPEKLYYVRRRFSISHWCDAVSVQNSTQNYSWIRHQWKPLYFISKNRDYCFLHIIWIFTKQCSQGSDQWPTQSLGHSILFIWQKLWSFGMWCQMWWFGAWVRMQDKNQQYYPYEIE